MYTARLNSVKSKFNSISNNPLMETTKNLGNLQNDLRTEQSNNSSYISQNSSLSSQFSAAQNNLNNTQANLNNLQNTLTNQQNLAKKIPLYLNDYQENNNASLQSANEEKLTKKLIGDLEQLSLE